jgi:hypothetical protein
MKKLILIFLILLSSCQLMPEKPVTASFNLNDYDNYIKAGDSTIQGQAFLKQNGGGVVTCAGNDVYLMPDTDYFREAVAIVKTKRKPSSGENKEIVKTLIKKSQCDSQGNFEFNKLPADNWIIVSEVKWKVGYSSQGGALMRNIATEKNSTIKVLLTDNDRL